MGGRKGNVSLRKITKITMLVTNTLEKAAALFGHAAFSVAVLLNSVNFINQIL